MLPNRYQNGNVKFKFVIFYGFGSEWFLGMIYNLVRGERIVSPREKNFLLLSSFSNAFPKFLAWECFTQFHSFLARNLHCDFP